MQMNIRKSFFAIFYILVISGCQPGQLFGPTLTLTTTITPTSTSTLTTTPTLTRTPTLTLTYTPSSTFTITSTFTQEPLSSQSKHFIKVALQNGFKSVPYDCPHGGSCKAYQLDIPYMFVAIYNDGRLEMIVDDETSWFVYIQPEGAQPPYDMKYSYYGDLFVAFGNNVITSNQFWIMTICDVIMANGSMSRDTDYGYMIDAKLNIANKKIELFFTPPQ